VFANLVPIVIAAALIAFGLWRSPDKMTTGFLWFGKGLVFVISIALAVSVFEYMTGKDLFTRWLPDGWEMAPPTDGLYIVGLIGMMLLGAFPAVYLIVTFAEKPLARVGKLIGINDKAAGGMIATLANNIPMFQIFREMDARGKILNAAFAVSAAFTFGDHLGFTAGVERSMIFPMIVGKLAAGFTAVFVAWLFFRKAYPAWTGEPVVAAPEGTATADSDGHSAARESAKTTEPAQ
jgi:ethanolamine transporter